MLGAGSHQVHLQLLAMQAASHIQRSEDSSTLAIASSPLVAYIATMDFNVRTVSPGCRGLAICGRAEAGLAPHILLHGTAVQPFTHCPEATSH